MARLQPAAVQVLLAVGGRISCYDVAVSNTEIDWQSINSASGRVGCTVIYGMSAAESAAAA